MSVSAPHSGTSNSSLESISETHGKKIRSKTVGDESIPLQKLSAFEGKENGLSSSAEIHSIDSVIEEGPQTNLSNGRVMSDSDVAAKEGERVDSSICENGNVENETRDSENGNVENESRDSENNIVETGDVMIGKINGEVDHNVDINTTDDIIEDGDDIGETMHEVENALQNSGRSKVNNGKIARVDDVELVMENDNTKEELLATGSANLNVCNGIENNHRNQVIENKDGSREAVEEQNISLNGPSSDSTGYGDDTLTKIEEEKEADGKAAQEVGNGLTANEEMPRKTSQQIQQQSNERMNDDGASDIHSDGIVHDEVNEGGAKPKNGQKRLGGKVKSGKSNKKHEGTCKCYPRRFRQKRTDNCSVI